MEWTVDRLIDHIVSTHHAYVRSSLPAIDAQLTRLVEDDRGRHPELTHVSGQFARLRRQLERHLLKEEQVLFPYIRELSLSHGAESTSRPPSPFGTIQNPIRMMEREHGELLEILQNVRDLTHDYAAAAGGRECMAQLAAFDHGLREHLQIEDRVLFPKAIELEL